MILKGSQRGGARQLAAHLMNIEDNEHVTVAQTRGFVSEDLFGAMAEAQAVARGTKCRQCVFSLSLNPPKDADITTQALIDAVEKAEAVLGLNGQPRAVVIHEKLGRKHAHAVWSRIDGVEMKAINMAFFKRKLNGLSKELYLEHGWELPEGHKQDGWKNPLNFSLAEWQQAKRLEMDPREIKQSLSDAWQRSDGLKAFRASLEAQGFYLARGDQRGFVIVDLRSDEILSLSRWLGVKPKEIEAKLGKPQSLPGIEDMRRFITERVSNTMESRISEQTERQRLESSPLGSHVKAMTTAHRKERERLGKKLEARQLAETKSRADRFRRGIGVVLDVLTGRLFALRKQNEREAYECFIRDRAQREQLCSVQLKERQALQRQQDQMAKRHYQERHDLRRKMAQLVRAIRPEDGLKRDRDRARL